MSKLIKLKKIVCIIAILIISMFLTGAAESANEKVGVLIVSSGETENYDPRFSHGYFEHLFPFFPPGFMAGRTGWEGDTCYSAIHFADEVEAVICGVSEGDAIDIFCNVHPEYEGVDSGTGDSIVHGIFRHSTIGFFGGDDTFRTNCFDDGVSNDPAVLFTLLGSETLNPYGTLPMGGDNLGPHVDDPNGPGIGIADFVEVGAFNRMRTHYYTFNSLDYKDPYDAQVKEWYYGAGGSTNIQAELQAALLSDPMINPDTEVVFRHTSEAFVENKDIYGQDYVYTESVETAMDELINDEGVDRIIVFSLSSEYTNIINYGPFWRDEYGNGISVIPGKTYQECIEDINDGYGPETVEDRDQLIADKPWDMYKVIMQEVTDVNNDINNGSTPLSFTKDYGTSSHYEQANLAMLEYTVTKYSIPDTASLKVVLTSHGYDGGYLGGAECDVYFRKAPETTNRVISFLQNSFSWNGKLAIVAGDVEYAQPGEGSNYDPPSPGKPFGDKLSAGEQIDMAIKGKYINELGEIIDNGLVDNATNEVYDYVILIPNTFDAESSDTLGHARACVFGNHMAETLEGTIDTWVRDEVDQNGLEFGDPAGTSPHYPFHDSENFTVRVMDASGWCTDTDDATPVTVCKGTSAINDPTTVIMSGTVLSYPDGTARQEITRAAVEVIMDAIKSGDIYDQPPEITGGPVRLSDSFPISTDPEAPTLIDSIGQTIVWMFDDDKVDCSGPFTHTWSYRTDSSAEWIDVEAGTYLWWVWTEDMGAVTGGGAFEFKVAVTDCTGQTTESDTGYIVIDIPPQITGGPVRVSDSFPISTDPEAPTLIDSIGQTIVWMFDDDNTLCSGPFTHTWSYRADSSAEWIDVEAGTYLRWVWTEDMGAVTGGGDFEFKVSVTDCTGQTTESYTHYISVDNP